MSHYPQQKTIPANHYDEMLQEIMEIDPGVISAVVPGSKLQEYMDQRPADRPDEP